VSQVADEFRAALSGDSADYGLKMLDSTFRRPTGQEQGEVLVVDFGGTNIRLLLVDLKGQRKYEVLKQQVINLRQNRSGIDLASESAQADQLFDFIADEIGNFVEKDRDYWLGHTFSFPARHLNRNSAILMEWTKEIMTRWVVGQDINALLQKSLHQRGIANIQTTAIINDAVGTLLAGAYSEEATVIGSICGTGHNSCFVDNQGQLINIESGNFFSQVLPVTKFDRKLDNLSYNPQAQRLEKMVGGAYLGELFRLIILELVTGNESLPHAAQLRDALGVQNCIETRDISILLQERVFMVEGKRLSLNAREMYVLEELASRLAVRSAQLIAATYAGIINYLDPGLQNPHIIAIDGSLYEKMPVFPETIHDSLKEIYHDRHHMVQVRFRKDASGIGAAVAAAIT
jgi:hexokinase